MATGRYADDGGSTASAVNLVAGLWLIISPWVFAAVGPGEQGGFWNSIIVGVVIAALAASRLYGATAWPSWVNALLGGWVVVSPFVFAYTGNAAWTWNSVIVGVIVLILGITSATAAEPTAERARDTRDIWSPAYGERDYEGGPAYRHGSSPARGRVGGTSRGAAEEWRSAEAGDFRGLGPRGWQRSDEQIRDEVCSRMADDPMLDASDIEVRVNQGEVTLEGSVTSRHARRLAEQVADSVSGVRDVNNALRVRTAGRAA
jgi:hypothetical protein